MLRRPAKLGQSQPGWLAVGGDRFGRPPNWLPWAAAIAAALPALNCLQRGQVGLLQLYLLLLGFRLLVATASARPTAAGLRSVLAGSILALAVVIKVTAALPVGLLLIERLAAARRHRSAERNRGHGGSVGLTVGLAVGHGAVAAAGAGGGDWLAAESRLPGALVQPGADQGHRYRARSVCRRFVQRAESKPGQRGAAFGQLDRRGSGRRRRQPAMPRRPGDPPRAMDRPLGEPSAAWGAAGRAGLGGAGRRVGRPTGRSAGDARACSPWDWWRRWSFRRSPGRIISCSLRRPCCWSPGICIAPGGPRLAWWMAWTPTVLVVPHYLWPAAAGQVGWLGIGITVWLIGGGVLLWAVGRKTRRTARRSCRGARRAPELRHCGEIERRRCDRSTDRSASCRRRLLLALLADLIHQKTDGQARFAASRRADRRPRGPWRRR